MRNSLPSMSANATANDERVKHEYDDDGVCVHCGFDGAEWHWWKHSTYEGRASTIERPDCKPKPRRFER
jgi:hypothetical protein